jgi:tetratricopeptide (TPR) repeat protein
LPKDLAEVVAGHLVLAGELIDTDPELAYGHAEAARRRAARLPIAREATAETAYAAGHYDVALSEFRALRRMTGMPDYLPVMADCERALGRPHAAIKLAKEARGLTLDPALQIEMTIVEAGARADLGQSAEGLRLLDQAVSRVGNRGAGLAPAVARLRYAYADALLVAGQEAEARRWFASAADIDVDGVTDADERRDRLDGLLIDFDEAEFEPDDARVADQNRDPHQAEQPDERSDSGADGPTGPTGPTGPRGPRGPATS